MKRSFTFFSPVLSLLVMANIAQAQTCSMSTTDPNPDPAFNSSLAVSALNGFSSPDQSTVGTFTKGNTTTLVSPVYYYNNAQTETYFKYHLATTSGSSLITGYSIKLVCQTMPTMTCSGSVSYPINTTGADYYFSFNPADAMPALKYFQVIITLTIAGGGNKDVVASAFQSNGRLAPEGIILPVNFVAFTATKSGNSNKLMWKVGAEENVSGYQVERSSDGRNYSSIGYMRATGNNQYTYTDYKVSGTNYYRIKSVDIDGKTGYSTVEVIKNEDASFSVAALPSLVTDELKIQYQSTSAGVINISTVDGRLVRSFSTQPGDLQTSINFSSEKKGIYILQFLTADGRSQTIKLIKQ